MVLDPFCGTGSMIIAAAHYGAMTMGFDIDIRVIKYGKHDMKGFKVWHARERWYDAQRVVKF
jgi:tRNA G10  N-methylase Trm11